MPTLAKLNGTSPSDRTYDGPKPGPPQAAVTFGLP
jgi:hypothetical protein